MTISNDYDHRSRGVVAASEPRACGLTGCSITSADDATGNRAAQVHLVYVTDPLCSGCWTLEPAWRRLLYRYGDALSVRYVYGGLLPSWDGFRDANNGIAAPADVAAHWDAVSAASG